jgi:hypothetical protein
MEKKLIRIRHSYFFFASFHIFNMLFVMSALSEFIAAHPSKRNEAGMILAQASKQASKQA